VAFRTLGTNNPNNVLLTQQAVNYVLQYDSTNGQVRIIQQNAPSGTLPIYQNGQWNASATQIGLTQQQQNSFHNQTQQLVYSGYQSAGGRSAGAVLPPWAQQQNFNRPPGQTSSTPNQNNSSSNNGSGNGLFTGLSNLTGAITNLPNAINNFAVNGAGFAGAGNDSDLFGTTMMYPIDMNVEQQDTLQIIGFRYQPSKSEALFGGDDSVRSILSGGLQTRSNQSQRIGLVILPMPSKVSDSNNVSWGEDAMNNLNAAAAANVIGNPLGSGIAAAISGAVGAGGGTGVFLKQLETLARLGGPSQELSTLLGPSFASRLLKMGGFGVESESILARGAGIVPNSNLELLFNGPTLRSFTFSYRLTPRSESEATRVRRIIRFFKQSMAVKKTTSRGGAAGQASFFLGTPNIFQLEYRTRSTASGGGQFIDGVNRFKTCALTSFQCDYTPDGFWAAYQAGQPISTVMSMTFNELEPLYDTDYQEGNIFSDRSDLNSVNAGSIGY
jgi:hypothetical protein